MNPTSGNPYYDPRMPSSFWSGNLPHFEQAGKIHYLTFRLHDSLPQDVVLEYQHRKEQFLRDHPRPWDEQTQRVFGELVSSPIEGFLDAGYGECVLKDPAVRQYLVDAIDHYDGERYLQWGYVVMPNHVHMLVMPLGEYGLDETIKSVMRFSATQINRHLGSKGQLWQTEPFDRIIRTHQHYVNTLKYVRYNPIHLPLGTYCFGGLEFREGE